MMFNGEMTREEAWRTLYSSLDGKDESEVERIKEEYFSVLPQIVSRELEGPPCLTSYKI